MGLSQDLHEFLSLLVKHEVAFMLVGAHAVAVHGFVRNTEDIDFSIRRDADNAQRVLAALEEFGFGGLGLNESDLLAADSVIQLGRAPNRIDLLNFLTGVEFEACYRRSERVRFGDQMLAVIALPDLLINKRQRAAERPRRRCRIRACATGSRPRWRTVGVSI